MEREIPPGSYICRPAEWERTCKSFRIFFDFIFALLSLYAVFRKYFEKNPHEDDIPIRTMGARTMLTTTSSLKRQDSHDTLMKWIPEISGDPNLLYPYSSMWEALESIIYSSLFSSHAKRCARLIINDSEKCVTNAKIATTAKTIKRRAERSVKFRFLFKRLVRLLDDIELSHANNLTDFMKALAVNMLQAEDSYVLQYALTHFRAFNQKSQNAYETSLATTSLFIREGAGIERFLLMGGWRNPKDTHDAGLTLLMYFAVETCGASCDKEINVAEFTGFDRVLFSPMDRPFVRYLSRSVTKSDRLFKDKIMYDISLNFCNEYVESSWSNDKIERAVWALQYGLKHFTKDTYEDLQSMNGKHKLDLTGYEPMSLLAFSICGVAYFQGRNECAYKLTGDPLSSIVINGSLPKPSVKDFLALNLLKKLREGRFIPNPFPGRSKRVKAMRVDNSFHLIESLQTEPFDATLEQVIC